MCLQILLKDRKEAAPQPFRLDTKSGQEAWERAYAQRAFDFGRRGYKAVHPVVMNGEIRFHSRYYQQRQGECYRPGVWYRAKNRNRSVLPEHGSGSYKAGWCLWPNRGGIVRAGEVPDDRNLVVVAVQWEGLLAEGMDRAWWVGESLWTETLVSEWIRFRPDLDFWWWCDGRWGAGWLAYQEWRGIWPLKPVGFRRRGEVPTIRVQMGGP